MEVTTKGKDGQPMTRATTRRITYEERLRLQQLRHERCDRQFEELLAQIEEGDRKRARRHAAKAMVARLAGSDALHPDIADHLREWAASPTEEELSVNGIVVWPAGEDRFKWDLKVEREEAG